MINKILLSSDQALALQNYKCLESCKHFSYKKAADKYRYEYFRSLAVEECLLLTPALVAFVSLVLCKQDQEVRQYIKLLKQIEQEHGVNKINMFIFANYLQAKV